jgi:hypothetical protein
MVGVGDGGQLDAGESDAADGGSDADTVDAGPDAVTPDSSPCGSAVSNGPVLLDLGHGAQIHALAATNTRLASLDKAGRWNLWNVATRARLATGDVTANSLAMPVGAIALKGNTLMVAQAPDSIELWDAATGVKNATISGARTYQLAADGSYLVGVSSTSLAIWDSLGASVLDRPGNYASAVVYAAAGEVRVALGPAGSTTIESIATSGTVTTASFSNGTFHSWFGDGESFFTRVGTTVWVYPKGAGTAKGIFALSTVENLAGWGDRFWTLSAGAGNVYSVPGTSSPIASFSGAANPPMGTGPTKLAILTYGEPSVSIVDLAAATPTLSRHALPAPYSEVSAQAGNGSWFVGNRSGLVYDMSVPSAPRMFGCGAVWSMSSADDGTLAIGTASGVLLGRLTSNDFSVQGRLSVLADQVALNAAGTALVTRHTTQYAQYDPVRTLTAFALPSGVVTDEWPMEYPTGNGVNLFSFDFARNASRIALVSGTFSAPNGWFMTAALAELGSATPTTLTGPTFNPQLLSLRLSTDGTRWSIATSTGDLNQATTNLYRAGTLVGAVAGVGIAWLSDTRLLVAEYQPAPRNMGLAMFKSWHVHDDVGGLISSQSSPGFGRPDLFSGYPRNFFAVSPSRFYFHNAIRDMSTGLAVWTGSSPADSVVAATVIGNRVLSAVRGRIIVENY